MKLCPNCNEWFDDDKSVCPHCGYRYKEDDERVRAYVDNDLGKFVNENTKKHNPWIVSLAILLNLSIILSIIDLFVSDFCWSCFVVIIMAAVFLGARLIFLAREKRLSDKSVRLILMIFSIIIIFYALVISKASKIGQDLSYMVHYIIPTLYIAYNLAVMIRFFVKKITMTKVVSSMLSIVGICLILALIGAITFKAQGFALAMCLIPFALSFLIALNMGIYLIIDFKKKMQSLDNEDYDKDNDEEINPDYEVLKEDDKKQEDK